MTTKNLLDFPKTEVLHSDGALHISSGGIDYQIKADDLTASINGGRPATDYTFKDSASSARLITTADRNSYITFTNVSGCAVSINPLSLDVGDSVVLKREGGVINVNAVDGAVLNGSASGTSLTEYGQLGQIFCKSVGVYDFVAGGNASDILQGNAICADTVSLAAGVTVEGTTIDYDTISTEGGFVSTVYHTTAAKEGGVDYLIMKVIDAVSEGIDLTYVVSMVDGIHVGVPLSIDKFSQVGRSLESARYWAARSGVMIDLLGDVVTSLSFTEEDYSRFYNGYIKVGDVTTPVNTELNRQGIRETHPSPPKGDTISKLVLWRNADRFEVVSTIPGSENQAVLQRFEQGITTAASSVGGPGEHYRLVFAMKLNDVYVASNQPFAQSAGVTTAIPDVRDYLGAISGGGSSFDNNNGQWPAYNIPDTDSMEFLCGTSNNTPKQPVRANVAFIVTSPLGSTDVSIEISDGAGGWVLLTSVDLNISKVGASDGLMRVGLNVPAGTRKLRVTNNTTGQCYCIGANIYRLHEVENHDIYVDSWSYWRNTAALYTNTSGASDYAIYDKANERFMGSFHGGETRSLLRLYFDDDASLSVVPSSGFKLFNSLKVRQDIDIDGQLTCYANYVLSSSGGLTQQYSMQGLCHAQVFYTNMMTTNPSFRKVLWPNLSLPSINSSNYKLGNVNTVVQRDDGSGAEIRCTFSQFDLIDDKNQVGSYIWNNANYAKLYNSPIALSGDEFRVVTDISFIEIKEFS